MMDHNLVLCVLLWANDGHVEDLVSYEDRVLALVAEHGGALRLRLRKVEHSEGPDEVQVLEFASEETLDAFMRDERRAAMKPVREAAVARTEVFRMEPVS